MVVCFCVNAKPYQNRQALALTEVSWFFFIITFSCCKVTRQSTTRRFGFSYVYVSMNWRRKIYIETERQLFFRLSYIVKNHAYINWKKKKKVKLENKKNIETCALCNDLKKTKTSFTNLEKLGFSTNYVDWMFKFS